MKSKRVISQQLGKKVFFLLGVSSLISWNSILTSLDYFVEKFPNSNVPFLFPIPMYIGTNIFGILVIKLAKYISLEARIYGGLLIMSLMNLLMPLFANFITGSAGFIL
jgi:hypothetical protein